MRRHVSLRRSRGVTLIELIVSITVIAIAGAALSGTLAYLNSTGSLSILQAQAQSIANAYLNEITGKGFVPNGVEANRSLFNDINDYNGLNTSTASDEFGNAMGNFGVTVAVVPGVLNGLPAADVRRATQSARGR